MEKLVTKEQFEKLINIASQPLKEEKKKEVKKKKNSIELERQPDPKAKKNKQ